MSEAVTDSADTTVQGDAGQTDISTVQGGDTGGTFGGLTTPRDGESLFGTTEEDAGNVQGEGESSTETTDNPELILGKFKSQDDLIKSYQALEAKMKSKEPASQVPETYDFQTAATEAGLTPYDTETEEGKADAAAFESFLRENNLSQKQTNALAKYGKEWMQKQLLKFGPQVDLQSEVAALRQDWGDKTEATAAEIVKWTKANLPPAVVNKPLMWTAEGMKFLQSLMKDQRGPVPMSNTRSPATSKDDLTLELQKIFDDADYGLSTPTGHALQNKAMKLSEQISRMK